MEWVPGEEIGHGSFSTVRLGRPKVPSTRFPEIMAVKSSNISNSKMLLHEKSVLMNLQGCPHVIRCFGNDHTKENGKKKYNLFLEYAGGGTLLAKLKKQPSRRFQESDVRRYTKSMLQGIKYIHDRGYVHRDLKLENVLVCLSSKGKENVKIADFGVTKSSGEKKKKKGEAELRGTPLYFSPETLSKSEQEPPADVWAVGCMVAEMLSGAPVWRGRPGEDGGALLTRIALAEEMPDMPSDLSAEGRDFLGKIFVKNPAKRWTAQMLLDHPFIADQPCDQDTDLNDGYESSESACTVTKGSLRVPTVQKFRSLMMCWISER